MDRGASIITASMVQNLTAFHFPAAYDDVKCLQALWDGTVRAGKHQAHAALNLQTCKRKENPLHRAVRHNAVHAVKWLLEHNVEMSVDSEGCTAFHRAVLKGNLELVRLILSAPYIDRQELLELRMDSGFTALHGTAYQGNAEICTEILRRNPNLVCMTTKDDYTPVHVAAIGGHARVVEVVASMSRSEIIDLLNKWQMTALMEAIANGHPDAVKTLLEQDAAPTISASGKFLGDRYDTYNPFMGGAFTALHTAVAWQEPRSLKLVLNHGKRHLNSEDFERWVKYTDYWDRTALELALDIEDDAAMQILVDMTGDMFSPMMDQMKNDSKFRRSLVDLTSRLHWSNRDLHPAARPDFPKDGARKASFAKLLSKTNSFAQGGLGCITCEQVFQTSPDLVYDLLATAFPTANREIENTKSNMMLPSNVRLKAAQELLRPSRDSLTCNGTRNRFMARIHMAANTTSVSLLTVQRLRHSGHGLMISRNT
jgi:ankyrin repeat protein